MVRIGPFQLEGWHLGLIAVAGVVLLWFLYGLLVRVSGTWERVDEDVQSGKVERITIVQFGPFVRGRRMMKGGFQEFSGVMRGRSMVLGRIDHGKAMLIGQGFPEKIAEEIDGSLTARLRLTLSQDGRAIFGTFSPQKIEFTHHPPKITSRRFLEPSFRRYKLVSRELHDTEIVEPDEAQKEAAREKLRRTV
ncbi:MAG: hypothetical protein U1E65_24830 [Myxococcota bacterium]